MLLPVSYRLFPWDIRSCVGRALSDANVLCSLKQVVYPTIVNALTLILNSFYNSCQMIGFRKEWQWNRMTKRQHFHTFDKCPVLSASKSTFLMLPKVLSSSAQGFLSPSVLNSMFSQEIYEYFKSDFLEKLKWPPFVNMVSQGNLVLLN